MNIRIEDYIKERSRAYDLAAVDGEIYEDYDTGEIIQGKITDYEKLEYITKNIDKKYSDIFKNSYVLYKKHELDKWVVFLLKKIDYIDAHQAVFTLQKIGKNFKLYTHKTQSFRKGEYKSATEDEIKEMFGWHNRYEKTYEDKYLYIFKNELNRIKIGQAVNPEQRLINIKSQAGLEIELINKVNNSAKYESVLHKIFKKCNYMYEWFICNEEQESWLRELNEINIEAEINYIINKDKMKQC